MTVAEELRAIRVRLTKIAGLYLEAGKTEEARSILHCDQEIEHTLAGINHNSAGHYTTP